jgi:uncharacterized protein (DUF302 family)
MSRMSEASGIARTASEHEYAETVTRLRSEIERRQLTLFAGIDQRLEAERAGLRLRPTTLLIFGSPAAGSRVMEASPESAIDLPLKILIWQDEAEQVWVAVNDAVYLQRRHGLADDLLPVLGAAQAVVDAALA